VPLAGCPVVAFEGPHACGKTTLIYALAAHYRAAGVNVAISGEPARVSPFMEQIVLHGRGDFDLDAEVDLFGAQLSAQLRAARHHSLLLADKTLCNVLAYARLVLNTTDPSTARVLDAMAGFAATWAPIAYDVVFYLGDQFAEHQPGDAFRAKVAGLQDETADAVRAECARAGVALVDVPLGQTTHERVTFVGERLTRHGHPFLSLP
jgi:hypothetical protein